MLQGYKRNIFDLFSDQKRILLATVRIAISHDNFFRSSFVREFLYMIKGYTALGLVMSKKSDDCGWNLAKVATGRDTLAICTRPPSSRRRFRIIWKNSTIQKSKQVSMKHPFPLIIYWGRIKSHFTELQKALWLRDQHALRESWLPQTFTSHIIILCFQHHNDESREGINAYFNIIWLFLPIV